VDDRDCIRGGYFECKSEDGPPACVSYEGVYCPVRPNDTAIREVVNG